MLYFLSEDSFLYCLDFLKLPSKTPKVMKMENEAITSFLVIGKSIYFVSKANPALHKQGKKKHFGLNTGNGVFSSLMCKVGRKVLLNLWCNKTNTMHMFNWRLDLIASLVLPNGKKGGNSSRG